MSLYITIAETTSSILNSSLTINDNINARSTSRFIWDTTATVSVGQEVIITNDGTRVFGGTIDTFVKRPLYPGATQIRYDVTCIDYNQLADRKRVAVSYENKSAFYIVNDIVNSYLSAESVTTGTMQTGVNISKATFNRKTAAECFDYIKNSTGLNWNIDYTKELSLFYREDYTGTSLTEADILDIEVENTRQEYRNRQFIRAGQDETDQQSGELPTPKPDGNSKTFVLRYPLAKEPSIIVNGTTVSTSDVGINGLESGKKWYWNKNDRVIVHDASETTLSGTDSLAVTYTGLIKIVVQADNSSQQTSRASVEGGSGIYEAIEDVASIDDRQAALDYANGLLRKYANIPEIISIRTQSFRRAGQLVNITYANMGISGQYLIESVEISERQGQIFYNLRCLSGESLGSWVEFFRKLRKDSSDFLINQDEVLVILNSFSEEIEHYSTTYIQSFDALYPSDDLYPADDLYPNTAIVSEVTVSDQ
jgi:hypothetical protein